MAVVHCRACACKFGAAMSLSRISTRFFAVGRMHTKVQKFRIRPQEARTWEDGGKAAKAKDLDFSAEPGGDPGAASGATLDLGASLVDAPEAASDDDSDEVGQLASSWQRC